MGCIFTVLLMAAASFPFKMQWGDGWAKRTLYVFNPTSLGRFVSTILRHSIVVTVYLPLFSVDVRRPSIRDYSLILEGGTEIHTLTNYGHSLEAEMAQAVETAIVVRSVKCTAEGHGETQTIF